jgi:hypothetical protein
MELTASFIWRFGFEGRTNSFSISEQAFFDILGQLGKPSSSALRPIDEYLGGPLVLYRAGARGSLAEKR